MPDTRDTVPVRNVDSERAPPHCLLMSTGEHAADGSLSVVRPAAGNLGDLLVNGPTSVEPGESGHATAATRETVAYDESGGEPRSGDSYGSAAGDWFAAKGNTGFIALSGGRGVVNCIRAVDPRRTPDGAGTFNCDVAAGCFDPGDGSGQYGSLADCQAACPNDTAGGTQCDNHTKTYNCVGGDSLPPAGKCIDPGDGTGAFATLPDCEAACTPAAASVECNNHNCRDPGDGSGAFATVQDCLDSGCGYFLVKAHAVCGGGCTVSLRESPDINSCIGVTTITIDWGDGTTPDSYTVDCGSHPGGAIGDIFATAPTHTYAHDGTYTIDVTVVDGLGRTAHTLPVIVGVLCDSPPVVLPPAPVTADVGVTAVAGCSVTIGGAATGGTPPYTNFTITWGDGTTTTEPLPATHVYTRDGTYRIGWQVSDSGTPVQVGTGAVPVAVLGCAPALSVVPTNAGVQFPAQPCLWFVTLTAVGAITSISYVVDWGDGTTSTYPAWPPGISATISHTYGGGFTTGGGAGTYTVRVTATDGGTPPATYPLTLTADVPGC